MSLRHGMWYTSNMSNLIKSKDRVADFGEVFTHEREVKAMCDLVKDETERIDSRVLEPACGDGNFLAEILIVAELRIGDRVQVDLYGVCVVNRFGKGCVYLKTNKNKEVVFKYPESLAIGSIKKL